MDVRSCEPSAQYKRTVRMRGVSFCSPPLLLMSAPPSSTRATMMDMWPWDDAICSGARTLESRESAI